MSRATLIKLLILQTVVLVLVAWAGVYFARDEYLLARGAAAQQDDDEALVKPPSAVEVNGVPTVRLSVAAQRNVGIEVAMPEPARLGTEISVPLLVLDAQPLAELQGKLAAARHEAEAARAQAAASAAEKRRVQALYDDDRNASKRALETATAQAAADAARERSAQAQLTALREGARATWGAALARALEQPQGHGLIARLASGKEVLLRAALRGDEVVAPDTQLALVRPGRTAPVLGEALGAAGAGALGETGGARGLLFHAEAAGLVPGQRLGGQLREAGERAQAGVLIPASAIVWHAGQPWIYIRESNEPQAVSPPASGAAAPVAGSASASADAADARATTPVSSAEATAASRGAAPADKDDDDARPRASGQVTAAAPQDATSATALQEFQRRAVPYARRVGERFFLPGYAEDDPVVVRGGQVLLSEELKFQIRNENDD